MKKKDFKSIFESFLILLILICAGAVSRAFSQEENQSDSFISGFSLEKLTQSADYCYLTSKGREKYSLARERGMATLDLNRWEYSFEVLRDESKKPMNDLEGAIDVDRHKDLRWAIQDEQKIGAWLDKNCAAGTSLYLYRRRTKTSITDGYCVVKEGVITKALILVTGQDEAMIKEIQAEQKKTEEMREKYAKPIPWEWSDDKAKISYCIANYSGKYRVAFVPSQDIDGTCVVGIGIMRVIYKWRAHMFTVFQISGDTLYYTDCPAFSGGGNIIAVDLIFGNQLWDSPLVAIGQAPHSVYGNRLNLKLVKDTVVIFGRESYGDYIEVKDAKTGESIGHKIVTSK